MFLYFSNKRERRGVRRLDKPRCKKMAPCDIFAVDGNVHRENVHRFCRNHTVALVHFLLGSTQTHGEQTHVKKKPRL